MSQRAASVGDGLFNQPEPAEPIPEVVIEPEVEDRSSWSAEWFGIGVASGILLGGIAGVVFGMVGVTGTTLAVGIMFGFAFGLAFGLFLMENRRIRSAVEVRDEKTPSPR